MNIFDMWNPSKTPDEHAMDHAARVRAAMRGQRAPQSSTGRGRKALFGCPFCRRPWLMDGPQSTVGLEVTTLRQLAVDLQADPLDLPQAPCPSCARTYARVRIDRDEYVTVDGRLAGYGFNVEGDVPVGMHFVALVHHLDEFVRHRAHGLDTRAHVVAHPEQERRVWAWLATLAVPPKADQYERDPDPQDPNPPGHGAPGTATWCWGGAIWLADCPSLGGLCLVHLALAIPPGEQVTMAGLVAIGQVIAQSVADDSPGRA